MLFATPDKSALPDSLQNDSAVKSLQFETSNIYLNHESNFSKILATFACFFDKPMEQAISLPGLLSGREQEFVKLLLIFLAYAMKQKPNGAVILNILNLDKDVKGTLVSLITKMFKILDDKQIETFSDQLKSIVMEFNPSLGDTITESDTEMLTPPLNASADLLQQDNHNVKIFSALQDSLFGETYISNGLDSPAALKCIIQRENTRNTPAGVNDVHQLQHELNQQQESHHKLLEYCQGIEGEQTESLATLRAYEIEFRELSTMRVDFRDFKDECKALHSSFRSLKSTRKRKHISPEGGTRAEWLQGQV